jgi:hypothetical protein
VIDTARLGKSALLAVVLLPAGCLPATAEPRGAAPTATPSATTLASSAPGACAHPTPGPDRAPAGAITVDPAVPGDLSTKTTAAPPGTTFWLAPGRHALGTGQFAQVVPKDRDTFVGAPGAVLDGAGINAYAFTQKASGVTISNLAIQDFRAPRNEGVVNHDSADGWVITDDVIQNNSGAGLMAGSHQQVRNSCLRDNGQYGLNAYQSGDHISGLVLEGNEITGNNTDDWETKAPGCGCTGGAKFWAVNGADIRGNWIHANHGPGLWADTDNNDFLIEDNVITDNDGAALFYEISYNLTLRHNDIERNAAVQGRSYAARGDNFPVAAIYLSESGGEPAVPARTDRIDVEDNALRDNWGAVTVWENADRFCNSPANTSTGYCTPLVPDHTTCSAPGIAMQPLYDRCRWRSRRIDIHDNVFVVDGSARCVPAAARNALLSNFGTFPAWSPYKGQVVEDAITFHQDNSWHHNTYRGRWQFMAHDTHGVLTAGQWQQSPYSQDTDSTFTDGDSDAC